jgi:hypothetical protein
MQQARFFTTNSSYTFTVTPGRHWIRLYFYPFAFANWAANASLFSVTANQFVLLDDFRPSSWTTPDFPSLFREYAVNVSSESLVLGFDPAPGSYAFINALEVVSMPSDLYSDDASLLGQAGSITPLGLADCAIQAMFHINVGGASVSPQNDSTGMWRTWQPDDLFIFLAAVGTTGDVPVTTRRVQPRIRSVMTMPTMICAVASSQIDTSSYSGEPGRRCGAIMCVPIHIGLLSWLRGAHKAEQ